VIPVSCCIFPLLAKIILPPGLERIIFFVVSTQVLSRIECSWFGGAFPLRGHHFGFMTKPRRPVSAYLGILKSSCQTPC
jgi:hypothetical protein